MIVDRVVDGAAGDQWRHHDRRDANAVLCEIEAVFVGAVIGIVARANRDSRSDTIIEAAMLVVGDDEQAVIPVRRLADRGVDACEELLPAMDVVPSDAVTIPPCRSRRHRRSAAL